MYSAMLTMQSYQTIRKSDLAIIAIVGTLVGKSLLVWLFKKSEIVYNHRFFSTSPILPMFVIFLSIFARLLSMSPSSFTDKLWATSAQSFYEIIFAFMTIAYYYLHWNGIKDSTDIKLVNKTKIKIHHAMRILLVELGCETSVIIMIPLLLHGAVGKIFIIFLLPNS